MQKIIRRCLALALSAALALGCVLTASAAGESNAILLQYDVTYGQTEARAMLDDINQFRTGEDAWYWNEDNSAQQQVNLQELTYDYTLEQIAMQRAAEIALSFSHTRPNGESCFTAFNGSGIFWTSCGENIAMGYPTAQDAFQGWLETNEDYDGQGHRRNMLGDYTSIGIGHVVYNGVDYWVQEFGTTASGNTTPTPANDAAGTVQLDITAGLSVPYSLTRPTSLVTGQVGKSTALPSLPLTLSSGYGKTTVDLLPVWTVSDSSKAEVVDGMLVGKSVGFTTLTTNVWGTQISIELLITAMPMDDAVITLDQDSWSYTGQPITPAVTVTLNGQQLTEGTDYKLIFENNTEVGTAHITAYGTGNYIGATYKDFTITPCAHQWDQGTVTTPATCTAEGVRTYTCALCGATKTEAIAKLPHTPVSDPTVEATCTATGLTEGSHCSVCGEILTPQQAVPALGHSYDEGVITQEPTCTVDGEITYTCERCGATLKDPVDATGHSFGPWETMESPSCTDEGSEQRTCTACGYQETRNLDATGHSWETDYTVDQAATCTTDGSQSIHCANCSATKDAQVIPATGHSWDEGQVTTAATCTEPGVMTYHCSVCGATKTEPIPATGHSYDQGKVTQEATCTEPGVMTYTCTACGATYTEAIAALGHDYDEGVITQQPTCTEDGVITYTCELCGATLKDPVDAQGHSWDEGQVATEPTCDTAGIMVYTCQNCGQTNTETIPAKGHTFGDEWLSNEEGHWKLCQVCQEYETQTEAHTLVWLTDQAPTATEPGSCHEECTVCGYRGETKAIPATGTSGGAPTTGTPTTGTPATGTGVSTSGQASSPKTGDSSQGLLGISLLVLSCGGLTWMVLGRKKRRG